MIEARARFMLPARYVLICLRHWFSSCSRLADAYARVYAPECRLISFRRARYAFASDITPYDVCALPDIALLR